MARLVRHDQTGPYRIDPQDKPVFICGCGLSRNLPFCDGAHKSCRAEEPGRLYIYDANRESIVDVKPDEESSGTEG